jgi:hypothetical protein
MIVILTATADTSARAVERWLVRWGVPCLVIEDDDPVVEVRAQLSGDGEDAEVRTRSGRGFRLSDVRACWFRRAELRRPPVAATPQAERRAREWESLHAWLMDRLAARPTLGACPRPCSKLAQLSRARDLGLAIPATLITCSKAHVLEFIRDNVAVITKGIEHGAPFEEEDGDDLHAGATTRRLGVDDLARAPASFSPRLVQRLVDKPIELRVFCLAGALTAMALIPRDPTRLQVDARPLTAEDGYHLVPYALPGPVAGRLVELMAALQLDTGSIDMLVDRDGAHVFLEVNPGGQFEWLSVACDAGLERQIAAHLAQLAGAAITDRAPPPRRLVNPPRITDASEDPQRAVRRFAWADGRRSLVRPLYKPILRRFAAQRPPGAAATAPAPARLAAPPLHADHYVRLLASCAWVEGGSAALIYDFSRRRALRVPATLRWILTTMPGARIRDLRAAPGADGAAIDDAIAAGLSAGVLHVVADPSRFPDRPAGWQHPAELTSAVISVDDRSTFDLEGLLGELAGLGCEHALIRCTSAAPLERIDRAMARLADGPPLCLEWWLPWSPACEPAALIERCARHPRISAILVFAAPEPGEWWRTRSGVGNVLALAAEMPGESDAPPAADSFVVDAELFAESREFNTFFHRKAVVTADGEIRSGRAGFGRAGVDSLAQVIRTPAFARLGKLHKGLIEGCSDCALRHACVDPREPTPTAGGTYRHATPCPHPPR